MSDLVDRFERADLESLSHADHVRVACAYLERCGPAGALAPLAEGLARFAAAKGAPGKFHHTMTRAWLEVIAAARSRHPAAAGADALMDACPALRDPALLRRCYSPALLASDAARAGWVPPDLAPLDGIIADHPCRCA